MSRELHPAYRFMTDAQWRACQFVGADRRTATARKSLRPFAPYGLPPKTLWTGTGYTPTIGDEAQLIWQSDRQWLWTLPDQEEVATKAAAPADIASAKRLVAGPNMLWAVDKDGNVAAFDSDSFVRLLRAELGDLLAIDIASDSSDGIYVLGTSDCTVQIVHLGCAGNVDHRLILDNIRDASQLVFLGVSNRLVVLGSDNTRLHFIDAQSGLAIQTVHLSSMRSCFKVDTIGSDSCSRLFVARTDRLAVGEHHLLIADEDGEILGTVPVDHEVTGIVATSSRLYLTTSHGLLRFDPASKVPQGIGEVEARVVTPLLQSPATGAQKWIRVDAKVDLPSGCSIRISHATGNEEQRQRAQAALADPLLTPSQRLKKWRESVEIRTHTYHGDSRISGQNILSAPLHDVRDEFLWVEIALIAAPGGQLPVLSELRVLYPGATLIQHLPAIYRSGELTSGDFTRALVGVLEANTQDLDEKIAKLGSKIDPMSADSAWLDYVAGWLGLPWDDALSVDQKRCIVRHSAAIAQGYSTRSGLEALLECLLPGKPRKFRIVDMTAEFGLATIAGPGCEGSRLPAVLAGLPPTATELGNKSVLGKARLPCRDTKPDSTRLVGRIRVDIAASAEEQAGWSPWLGRLVEAMVPAAARVELRWLAPAALRFGQIHADSRLMEEFEARLGSDAITGASRLGGRARAVLPGKLTNKSTLQ